MQRLLGIAGSSCPSVPSFVSAAILIVVDAAIAAIAFSQLLRIHLRSQQPAWNRQKVFHLMIGLYNVGYVTYFISSLVAASQKWRCWSRGCGFILMAWPQILLLATFLLLLSFWTDLCHQPSDDEEEDDDQSTSHALLEKSNSQKRSLHVHVRCCSFFKVRIGSRQKYVFLVIVLTFLFMIAMALLIWFARGKNPLDPLLMFKVYLDVFSVFIIILGLALAIYGGILFSKMRRVRAEMTSTEMWKVASLAIVSLICFTSSSALALITSSSVPSSCVLWSMREMPSRRITERPPQSRIITIIRGSPPGQPNPQWRTAVTNSQNKDLRVSPI